MRKYRAGSTAIAWVAWNCGTWRGPQPVWSPRSSPHALPLRGVTCTAATGTCGREGNGSVVTADRGGRRTFAYPLGVPTRSIRGRAGRALDAPR